VTGTVKRSPYSAKKKKHQLAVGPQGFQLAERLIEERGKEDVQYQDLE
jgi:hypothetical protein